MGSDEEVAQPFLNPSETPNGFLRSSSGHHLRSDNKYSPASSEIESETRTNDVIPNKHKNGYANGFANGHCNGYIYHPKRSIARSRLKCNTVERLRTLACNVLLFYLYLPRRVNNTQLLLCFTYMSLIFIAVYAVSHTNMGAEYVLEGKMYGNFYMASDLDLRYLVNQELRNKSFVRPSLTENMSYRLLVGNTTFCEEAKYKSKPLYVLWLIKSSANHSQIRNAIRQTWGAPDLLPYVATRTVFVLGKVKDPVLHKSIIEEQQRYGDLIQGDFLDTYYNNTIKLMTGVRWATSHCSLAKFIAFIDDDFFLSPFNVVNQLQSVPEMENQHFVMGCIQHNAHPYRYKHNKWYTSYEEYPFSRWPDYPAGGTFFVPMITAKYLDAGFYYTKQVKFDDVLIGYIAQALKIPLIDSENIYLFPERFPGLAKTYATIIGVHGIKEPKEMKEMWTQYNNLRRKIVSIAKNYIGNFKESFVAYDERNK